MDYKWEIENVNLDLYDFDTMQKIFCKKIANVIIQSKKQNCAIWKNIKSAILKLYYRALDHGLKENDKLWY